MADNTLDGTTPAYTEKFEPATWRQGLFSVKCKLDTRRGTEERRVQTTVARLRLLGDGESYVRESKALLDNIRKYLG